MARRIVNLIGRAIAAAIAALIIRMFRWGFFRYAAAAALVGLLFIAAAILRPHVGQWGREVTAAIAFTIPLYLIGIPVLASVWAVRTRAIEPPRQSATLAWDESEMADVVELDTEERRTA